MSAIKNQMYKGYTISIRFNKAHGGWCVFATDSQGDDIDEGYYTFDRHGVGAAINRVKADIDSEIEYFETTFATA